MLRGGRLLRCLRGCLPRPPPMSAPCALVIGGLLSAGLVVACPGLWVCIPVASRLLLSCPVGLSSITPPITRILTGRLVPFTPVPIATRFGGLMARCSGGCWMSDGDRDLTGGEFVAAGLFWVGVFALADLVSLLCRLFAG